MSRPRIAVLADWWWPNLVGGAERSSRSAALELARTAEVAVFVPAPADQVYPDGPLTVHAVRRPYARRVHADSALRRGLELLTAWLLPTVASRQIRALRAYRPDVVVATNISRTGPWLLRWARANGVRLVRSYHDLSDTCWRRSRRRGARNCVEICADCRVKTRVMRRATPPATIAVCVSGFVRDELARAGLTSGETSLVGYPLIGPPSAPPQAHRRDPARVVLGYLGRVAPVKGVEAAIRTAAAYRRNTGAAVTMLVAGEGQPDYLRRLADLATGQQVDVDFAGHLDVEAFCARIDAALIPSTWMEPFGRVAVEVGSHGRPMLVSRVGGLPEAAAVSGGRYAFTDFTDPEAAARALGELLDPQPDSTSAPAPGPAMPLEQGVVTAVARALQGWPGNREEQPA
ncbi:glycosyltransferase family 4 protein [Plantactinospora sp. CA-294935]|uniref:glycosyltransferase family 4 protein n=1 Tax=Plantactinospora sp. CA-294935 TaxID=3240012 RepID=UPI003D8C97F7